MNNANVKPTIRFSSFTIPWDTKCLIDYLAQPISDGPHETPKLVEDGIPFISVDAIVDNRIDFSRKRGDHSPLFLPKSLLLLGFSGIREHRKAVAEQDLQRLFRVLRLKKSICNCYDCPGIFNQF